MGGVLMVKESELTKDIYRTGEVAEFFGVTPGAVMHWVNNGKLKYYRLPSGHRRFKKEDVIDVLKSKDLYYDDLQQNKIDVIYGRVPTHKQIQRGDLDRQVEKIKLFAIDQNVKNLEVITDVASGLNDNRKGLNKLLSLVMDNKVDRIFVLYKDRLTRFGLNYLLKVFKHYRVELIIVSSEETNKTLEMELAEDIISIIHSFSGKLYGMRRKVSKVIQEELRDGSKTR